MVHNNEWVGCIIICMDIHKSLSLNHTHIDNFSIKSKASDNVMW